MNDSIRRQSPTALNQAALADAAIAFVQVTTPGHTRAMIVAEFFRNPALRATAMECARTVLEAFFHADADQRNEDLRSILCKLVADQLEGVDAARREQDVEYLHANLAPFRQSLSATTLEPGSTPHSLLRSTLVTLFCELAAGDAEINKEVIENDATIFCEALAPFLLRGAPSPE
ncbi:hypothetical protein GCM10019059_39110 [Camelimonas fluminis]|nr:hypothetical protein GCM10019059_39110 [Camelimonas fluminis]